jgi:hypothetical protein
MGWSFRKSIVMGPLRVNVSQSGVGASVGVRGARVAVGPRGTYVSFGAGGFRYRRKLSSSPSSGRASQEATGNIKTASVEELADSTPEWLVNDSQVRLRKWNLFKGYCWTAGFLLFVSLVSSPFGATVTLFVVLAALGVLVQRWDNERRTARVIYDVDDPEIVERLAMANGAAQWLGHCHALWHIFHAVQTSDWKKNAGAGTLIRRTATRCAVGPLPCFELNVEAWSVPVGPQQLLFLPDRLLVWDGTSLAALPYETLRAQASPTRFIEDGGSIPRDAEQVDTTWRFVRRDGGPDLRFNDNRQLPVMRYGELELTSTSGLKVVLQTSTTAAADGAARALTALADRVRLRASHPTTTPVSIAPARPAATETPAADTAEQPAIMRAKSVTVLLKYLASADRRVDGAEVAFAAETLAKMLPAGHPDLPMLTDSFRVLSIEPSTVRAALQIVGGAGPEYSRWVLDTLTAMANADGKVTPKEVERLSEVRAGLGL